MEIVFKNVSYLELNKINLSFPNGKVIGVNDFRIIELLSGNKKLTGKISYDKEVLSNKNRLNIVKQICYIDKKFNNKFSLNTVYEYMNYLIYYNKLNIKDPMKKIVDSLRIVGLSKKYLERDISTLSKSEVKLFQVALALLSNPKVILLDNFYDVFDLKTFKRIMRVFNQLSEKYNISVIIYSKNMDFLYKYVKYVILFSDNKLLMCGDSKEVFQNDEVISKIDVPDIIKFVMLAKGKNISLDYHRDIRDLIKDIYKHV